MAKYLRFVFLPFVLVVVGVAQADSGFHGNVNALLGGKQVADGDFDELQDQLLLGVMFDFRGGDWPVNIAVDALVSGKSDEENDVDRGLATVELALGVRRDFTIGDTSIHPFVGGGVNRIGAGLTIEDGRADEDDSDAATGVWATAGAFYTLIEHVNLGAVYRYSHAKVELFDESYQVGGHHFALMAGYRW